MKNEETLEQARLVHATQALLHRHHLRRVCLVEGGDTFPVLTPPQINMIMTLRDHGQMTLKQLTQALHVKAPAASAMVERLVEMGILTRVENQADRREVLVAISPKEESKLQEMERRHLQLTVDLFEQLGPEYVSMWVRLCERLREVLRQDTT